MVMATKKLSIDEIIQNLFKEKIDRITKIRYPVRIILLNSFEEQKILEEETKDKVEIINLADIIPKNDKWITIEDIFSIIEECDQDKSYLIFGISEYIYSSSEEYLQRILTKFTEIENPPHISNRRIFIPLVGIFDIFHKIFNIVSRTKEGEWAPVYEIKNNTNFILNCYLLNNIDIESVEKTLNNGYKVVKSTKDWLSLHKESDINNKKLLILSESIKTLINKNNFLKTILNIKFISDYKNLLIDLFEINKNQLININYTNSEKHFWKELLKIIVKNELSKNNLFSEYIQKIASYIDYTNAIPIISKMFKEKRLFDIWMIKNYFLVNFPNSYLTSIFKNLNIDDKFSLSFLEEKIWLDIFNYIDNKEWIEERQILIEEIVKNNEGNINRKIENSLRKKIGGISSNEKKIELISGFLKFEKKILIELFKDNPELAKFIFKKYKELGYYLKELAFTNLKPEQNWILKYFKEYKISKVKNEIQKDLTEILNEKNKSENSFYEWYYTFDKVSKIYEKEKDNVDKIVWIDALGIEWISLIYSLITENNYNIENLYVCRSNLPTITECNKIEDENIISVKDLDMYIHSQKNYSYPTNIVDEIEIIKKIINRELLTGEDILVISDHGLTAFARSENISKYNFTKEEINHEGRCAWIDSNETVKSNEDFIVITQQDQQECKKGKKAKAVVSLKYISLGKPPRRETHGGATPEEVLVPIFKITPKKKKESEFKINKDKFVISPKNPIVEITIEPIPEDVFLKDKKRNIYISNYDSKLKLWKFDFPSLKPGKYIMELFINNEKFTELEVEIKVGLVEEELF